MKQLFLSGLLFLFSTSLLNAQNPKALIAQMIETIGGADKLYQLRDVEYDYSYHVVDKNIKDVSKERYIFDGELSWAEYTQHEVFVMPDQKGVVRQFTDGKTTMVALSDKTISDPAAIGGTKFLRDINYYWFAMMFKLLDPGVNHTYQGKQTVEGIEYDVIKITFGENVGDFQDTYVLYLNPYTHLVDQFLFNVVGAGMKDPILMKVQYATIDGATLPVLRRYHPAKSWKGVELASEGGWTLEISSNIKFNNGFTKADLMNGF